MLRVFSPRRVAWVLLLGLPSCTNRAWAAEEAIGPDSRYYYPARVGDTWYFEARRSKEPAKLLQAKAEIVGSTTRDGREYLDFSSPQFGLRYLVRIDAETGVLMRAIKYPFPIFQFPIEANLTPEMPILVFPLVVGARWQYRGTARARLLGLFSVSREIRADFECVERATLGTRVGNVDTFHIRVLVESGDGLGPKTEEYWWGRGVGYTLARTSNHFAEVVGYRLWDEEKGQWKTALPERTQEYR